MGALSAGFEILGTWLWLPLRSFTGGGLAGDAARGSWQGSGSTSELNSGDYVVHVHHGIGRYLGIREMEIDGIKRIIWVAYAGDDRLYCPVDQVGFIQKYRRS